MNTSVLTVLFLTAVIGVVIIGVLRGRHRTAPEALIRLGVIVLCAALAAVLAPALTRLTLSGVVDKLVGLLKIKGSYTEYPHFGELVRSVAFGLCAPAVFVVLFIPLWAIGAGVVSCCLKPRRNGRRGRVPAKAGGAPEDRQEAWCGALVGALAGLVFCICLTSPVIGTMRLTVNAVDELTTLPGVSSALLKPKAKQELTLYANDPVGSALYAFGGQLLYEGSARTEINGDSYGLARELDRTVGILGRAEQLIPEIMSDKTPDADVYAEMHGLIDELEHSPAARTLMADYIAAEAPGLADRYAAEAESGNGIAISLVDVMMQKCARTTYDTVCPDLHSVVDVLELLRTNDLNNLSYEEAVALLSESGILDNIYTVMLDAPSILSASEAINELVSSAFFRAALEKEISNPALYDAFVDDLVETFGQTAHYSDGRRLNSIRNCVSDYADMMKLDASDEIKEAVSYSIMSEFSGRETLTREDVISIFRQTVSGVK